MADHEHSVIKHNDHLLLEQPLLRLPYELLRKNFRTAHYIAEKESSAIKTLLKDTASASVAGRAQPPDVLRSLDTMLARMRGVKRKLAACADEEARLFAQTQARLRHVGELQGMQTYEDVKYEGWSRTRLDRLLVDYLLRSGFDESAKELAAEKGIENLVDIDTFVQMSQIKEALLGGSVTEALAWCQDNKKELRKMDSNLEFMLRFQQYIELVRTESEPKLAEAIAHVQKHLLPLKDTYPKEVQQACGLLAFPPGLLDLPPGIRPASYAELYSPRRWTTLADLFTRTHLLLLALPSTPLLHVALSSGLSALKTPACHSSASNTISTVPQPPPTLGSSGPGGLPPTAPASASVSATQSVCPICSTELNELARNVPYAHHTQSHVENDLLLLPNMRVYGKARLEHHAQKAGLPTSQVKDLRTGEVFEAEDLKKVFIT